MRAIKQFVEELSVNGDDVLALFRETIELVNYYRRLLEKYELDALTGLPGSNKFREYMESIENQAAGVGIIFFDVNGLKDCNDTKGHHSGDLLLQKTAESILHITDERDIRTFRVGGDEFAVIITDCNESDKDELLTKWRNKLDALNAADDGIYCSVAVGAAIGRQGDAISDVLALADERMYAEKRRMQGNVLS